MVRACGTNRRGFALADVIVGAVILGAALAVIVGLAGQAVTAQGKGRDLSLAAMLADEQLNLVLARGPDDYAKRYETQGTCDAPFEGFGYRLEFSGGIGAEPYTVAATILWSRAWGTQQLTIRTLVASRTGTGDTDPDPDRRPDAPVQRALP
ncbi:MAG: hypothetical protein KF699_09805 [Phycisphaeraceae bacterium]|nr:hypothetical protein [Phycisphaeraceae bacterium]